MTTGNSSATKAPAEDIVLNLIHDLRQPLGSIETIAYFLELRLPRELTEEREYVSQLHTLVQDAAKYLSGAANATCSRSLTNGISFANPQIVCADQRVPSASAEGAPGSPAAPGSL